MFTLTSLFYCAIITNYQNKALFFKKRLQLITKNLVEVNWLQMSPRRELTRFLSHDFRCEVQVILRRWSIASSVVTVTWRSQDGDVVKQLLKSVSGYWRGAKESRFVSNVLLFGSQMSALLRGLIATLLFN